MCQGNSFFFFLMGSPHSNTEPPQKWSEHQTQTQTTLTIAFDWNHSHFFPPRMKEVCWVTGCIFARCMNPLVAASPVLALKMEESFLALFIMLKQPKHARTWLPRRHSQVPTVARVSKLFLNDAARAADASLFCHLTLLFYWPWLMQDVCLRVCTCWAHIRRELSELLSELITEVASNNRTGREKKALCG